MPAGALEHTSPYHPRADIDVYVFPSFLDIPSCVHAGILTGAQYGREEPSGTFTGDVSMKMIADAKCRAVLCGHSDRRKIHKESNEEVAQQAIAAIENGLHAIVCIGETKEQRDKGESEVKKILKAQMKDLPLHSSLIIAYEPIWAIGGTVSASPVDAQEIHEYIRSLLPSDLGQETRILYGGSVTPDNVLALLEQKDIDGFLVGGASLKPDAFAGIIEVVTQ